VLVRQLEHDVIEEPALDIECRVERIDVGHAVGRRHRQGDRGQESDLLQCNEFEVGIMLEADSMRLGRLHLDGRHDEVVARDEPGAACLDRVTGQEAEWGEEANPNRAGRIEVANAH
jgi:hypothetical protein